MWSASLGVTAGACCCCWSCCCCCCCSRRSSSTFCGSSSGFRPVDMVTRPCPRHGGEGEISTSRSGGAGHQGLLRLGRRVSGNWAKVGGGWLFVVGVRITQKASTSTTAPARCSGGGGVSWLSSLRRPWATKDEFSAGQVPARWTLGPQSSRQREKKKSANPGSEATRVSRCGAGKRKFNASAAAGVEQSSNGAGQKMLACDRCQRRGKGGVW